MFSAGASETQAGSPAQHGYFRTNGDTNPLTELEVLAERLGIRSAGKALQEFVSCCKFSGYYPTLQRSVVSSGGMPFEVSLSARDHRPVLRVLTDVIEPGEALISRCVRGLDTIGSVVSRFSAAGQETESLLVALARLFPPGEDFAGLPWQFALWTAMRTDGEAASFRCYVNLQWRQWGHRLIRIRECLEALALPECSNAVLVLAPYLIEWASPVGISLDFSAATVRAARLHFSVSRLPVRQLSRLFKALGIEEYLKATFDFVELFSPTWVTAPTLPLLLSVGISQKWPMADVKFDFTLEDLQLNSTGRHKLLAKCEERFGAIASYHLAKASLEKHELWNLQYIGLTVNREADPYLNVYFGLRPLLHKSSVSVMADETSSIIGAFKRAVDFIQTHIGGDGALPMEAFGLPSEVRTIPEGWPDVYMTSFALQELVAADFGHSAEVVAAAVNFFENASEGGLYRYLPGFSYDADDSAMVAIALLALKIPLKHGVYKELLAFQQSDGGFRTFLEMPDQASHPVVTVNVVHSLAVGQVQWEEKACRVYLERWIFGDEFPACLWFYSDLLPLYLVARTRCLAEWFGNALRERILARLFKTRRNDGLWGTSGAEVLDNALAVLCCHALGHKMDDEITVATYLREMQLPDGGWCWAPLYSDSAGTWFGSRSVTTILAARAIKTIENGASGASR